MKDSYGFESKNQVRDKLKNFISKAYPFENQRKNLKVLTLLGHEDYELKQIWDPLGIPRENITSLEYNPKACEIIKDKNFGINLVKGSVDNYIAETDKKFDVINLDYQGYFNLTKNDTLKNIAYKQMLKNKGILSTWYSGRREDNQSKENLIIENYSAVQGSLNSIKESIEKDPKIIQTDKFREIMNYLDKRATLNESGDIREDYISDRILYSFQHPILNFEHHPLIKTMGLEKDYFSFLENLDSFKERNKYYLECLMKRKEPTLHLYLRSEESFENFKNLRKKIEKNEKISLEDKISLFYDFPLEGYIFYIIPFVKDKIQKSIKAKGNNPNETFLTISSHLISTFYTNPYFNKNNERYKYKGDKGTPMYVDFNLFENEDLTKCLSWKIDKNLKRINILDSWLKNKRNCNKLNKFEELSYNNYIYTKKGRQQVESPKTESIENQKLSNEQIYSLIEQGKTNKEIMQIDSSLSSQKIGARRAWITMRNEEPKAVIENKLEEKVVNVEPVVNSSQEGLSKEDAIFLLKEGFETKEILKTYPNAFTDYQLRGYKAAITAGRL